MSITMVVFLLYKSVRYIMKSAYLIIDIDQVQTNLDQYD